jgi:2-phospho-L-lactate transferase/gluconeogenesis factor (CofD/UPF0052 family)
MTGKISAVVAALALLALPATAPAAKGGHGKGHDGESHGKSKGCAKVSTRGFQVTGTLVSAGEGTVTLTVSAANKHARESGELADQDAARKGVQVKGATYTVPATDAFELVLGDDGALVPAAGDRVKVKGRIAVTKKRCAADGTSTADRYATPDVTRVRISHPETEAPETEAPETETQS